MHKAVGAPDQERESANYEKNIAKKHLAKPWVDRPKPFWAEYDTQSALYVGKRLALSVHFATLSNTAY